MHLLENPCVLYVAESSLDWPLPLIMLRDDQRSNPRETETSTIDMSNRTKLSN